MIFGRNWLINLPYLVISQELSAQLWGIIRGGCIAQNFKKHSCAITVLRKILADSATKLEHQNNKQKLQIHEALHIRNIQPKLNRINFETSANVLKCL